MPQPEPKLRAFIAGATGYTGRHVVQELARENVVTHAHVRAGSGSREQWVRLFEGFGALVDSTAWEQDAVCSTLKRIQPTHVFSLLGTTRSKSRADKSGASSYIAVDYNLTAMLLQAAIAAGSNPCFTFLSSLGANAATGNRGESRLLEPLSAFATSGPVKEPLSSVVHLASPTLTKLQFPSLTLRPWGETIASVPPTAPLAPGSRMHYQRILLSVTLAAALAACGGGDTKTPQAAAPVAPNDVSFTAVDFTFDGPGEIPAGPTRLTLVDNGKELHHMVVVKLAAGKNLDSLRAALMNPGPPPPWATFVGGPGAPTPGGGTANATLNLEAGNYVILCFVDTPDHKPHFTKGMMRALTVTAGAIPVNPELPAPTSTLTLSEYKFTPDKEFVAGKNTVRVVNAGNEAHEVQVIRLEPGKTMEDFGKWIVAMQGPPPATPLGGVSPIARGRDIQFDVDLVPGNYVLLCFLPDSTGKKMHFENGMIHQFEIK